MKTIALARITAASLLVLAWGLQSGNAQAASAPKTCQDGTTSTATGRGACSGHGGVQKAAAAPAASAGGASAGGTAAKGAAPAAQAAASAPKASSAANTAASGATAKCKDGTYSKSKHHSGTCSKHGGVDQWLDGSK